MQVITRTRIACPPEQVFDTLADLRNDTQWNSRVSSAELVSGEPIGPGSRFAIVNGGTPYDVTITTYERPSRLGIEASGKPDLTIAYTLTPTGEGTDLESSFDFRPRGVLKVLLPLLAPVVRVTCRSSTPRSRRSASAEGLLECLQTPERASWAGQGDVPIALLSGDA